VQVELSVHTNMSSFNYPTMILCRFSVGIFRLLPTVQNLFECNDLAGISVFGCENCGL
jgi:hypothetical protein